MQGFSAESSRSAIDMFTESQGQMKAKLIERRAILESVNYLKSNGFSSDEVQRCLVHYFYVDLDLLHEALIEH
jgi:hypothetical protein